MRMLRVAASKVLPWIRAIKGSGAAPALKNVGKDGNVSLCKRPCREALRVFLESQQAAAPAAPGGSPNLIEEDSTPSGFDSTSSAGSASTLQSASPTSPRHALHDVATRLDFGNGTVDDDVDMAAPTTRELATQTEERRYYGKAMEKQRRTAEEEDYKDTRQKLKAPLDSLPVPTDTDIRDDDGLSWEKPSPQQTAFIPAVLPRHQLHNPTASGQLWLPPCCAVLRHFQPYSRPPHSVRCVDCI